jgi:hypothetical protein
VFCGLHYFCESGIIRPTQTDRLELSCLGNRWLGKFDHDSSDATGMRRALNNSNGASQRCEADLSKEELARVYQTTEPLQMPRFPITFESQPS